MTSGCLDRKEVRGAIWGVHSTTDRPAGRNTGRLFLAFGGPVCADRISNCPLDRVLTDKNLIYLLNLQYYWLLGFGMVNQHMETRVAKRKSDYNLLIIGPRGFGWETNI